MEDQRRLEESSALVSFSAGNVRSFREQYELSMLPTRIGRRDVRQSVRRNDSGRAMEVLPVAGIFGANASGKSNVLHTMVQLRNLVTGSFRDADPIGRFVRNRFRLDPATAGLPTTFATEVVARGTRYTYELAIGDDRVVTEVAHSYPKGKPRLLFSRRNEQLEHGAAFRVQGRQIEKLLRPNSLFLSTAAAANHEGLMPLFEWFEKNLRRSDADNRSSRLRHTADLVKNEDSRAQVLELLRAADLGLTDVHVHAFPDELQQRLHRVFDVLAGRDDTDGLEQSESAEVFSEVQLEHRGTSGGVRFSSGDESFGTLVWAGLIGPLVTTMLEGSVLLVDELDASIHPLLVERFIGMFQDPATNRHGAQLIFNAHDPGLLGSSRGDGVLGRDQIWLTDKLQDGSTQLFPLSSLQPRKEEDIAGRYRSGRYGAVPILTEGDFAAAADAIFASPN